MSVYHNQSILRACDAINTSNISISVSSSPCETLCVASELCVLLWQLYCPLPLFCYALDSFSIWFEQLNDQEKTCQWHQEMNHQGGQHTSVRPLLVMTVTSCRHCVCHTLPTLLLLTIADHYWQPFT